MEQIYSIYKIHNNINGKCYIGFTSQLPHMRWKQHIKDAKRSELPIHRALKKYGLNNFGFEVIYQSKDRTHALLMECHFILTFQTLSKLNGYNVSTGGEHGGHAHTAETKKKISASLKGKNKAVTEAVLARNRKVAMRLRGKTPSRLNQINRLMSLCKRWEVIFPCGEVTTIVNLSEFCRSHNLDSSHMGKVAKGKLKRHRGFRCRLLDNADL